MVEPKEKPFKNISDTAYLVAAYRAFETERKDALFKDPYAKQLVGQHGLEVVHQLPDGKDSSWFLVARTVILDQWITDLIHSEKIDTVLNLASGLDTRAFRLSLPSDLNWYDIDLPEITQYKKNNLEGIKPKCQYHLIPLDLSDQTQRSQFFDSVSKDSKKSLIISEGFLMYLNPTQVADLAQELGRHKSFQFWLAELIGPVQLKLIQMKWGKAFKEANSQMQFAPSNGPDFFKQYGWENRHFISLFDKAIEIGRAPKGSKTLRRFASLFPKSLLDRINCAGIALLKKH